jgi:hypothetical protein
LSKECHGRSGDGGGLCAKTGLAAIEVKTEIVIEGVTPDALESGGNPRLSLKAPEQYPGFDIDLPN